MSAPVVDESVDVGKSTAAFIVGGRAAHEGNLSAWTVHVLRRLGRDSGHVEGTSSQCQGSSWAGDSVSSSCAVLAGGGGASC
eukprot:3723693-Pyramimonas_sp.AAC.1